MQIGTIAKVILALAHVIRLVGWLKHVNSLSLTLSISLALAHVIRLKVCWLAKAQGISAIFRCLMGLKQVCPLSPTLFGLYVDGLEKHLLNMPDIDAPTLMGVMVP